jgi:hypothetical protein
VPTGSCSLADTGNLWAVGIDPERDMAYDSIRTAMDEGQIGMYETVPSVWGAIYVAGDFFWEDPLSGYFVDCEEVTVGAAEVLYCTDYGYPYNYGYNTASVADMDGDGLRDALVSLQDGLLLLF